MKENSIKVNSSKRCILTTYYKDSGVEYNHKLELNKGDYLIINSTDEKRLPAFFKAISIKPESVEFVKCETRLSHTNEEFDLCTASHETGEIFTFRDSEMQGFEVNMRKVVIYLENSNGNIIACEPSRGEYAIKLKQLVKGGSPLQSIMQNN